LSRYICALDSDGRAAGSGASSELATPVEQRTGRGAAEEPHPEGRQQGVAGGVAQPVVDVLEPVDVDGRQQHHVVRHAGGQRGLQPRLAAVSGSSPHTSCEALQLGDAGHTRSVVGREDHQHGCRGFPGRDRADGSR